MKIVKIRSEWFYGEYQITAILEDGSEEFLFGYSPDQYNFPVQKLIGMTIEEALDLKSKMDNEYFRTHDR